MQRNLEAGYAVGRLAFGAVLMAAPKALGGMFMGEAAKEDPVRIALRFYGTRDVVLGLGTLRAAANGDDTAGWLAVGIASDVLDVAVQLGEWKDLPPAKRLPGVLAASSAAAAGAFLLARR